MVVDGVRDAEEVANILQRIVDGPRVVAEKDNTYLRRLFTFKLSVADEKDTYATAKKVFLGYFDLAFESCGIIFSGVAPETEIACDELVRDGKFSGFLGNTAEELERRRMLGSQFLAICRDNPERLRGGCRANLFILTNGDEEVAEDLRNVFVADVQVHGSVLGALLYEFRYSTDWNGARGIRAFSSQQSIGSPSA